MELYIPSHFLFFFIFFLWRERVPSPALENRHPTLLFWRGKAELRNSGKVDAVPFGLSSPNTRHISITKRRDRF